MVTGGNLKGHHTLSASDHRMMKRERKFGREARTKVAASQVTKVLMRKHAHTPVTEVGVSSEVAQPGLPYRSSQLMMVPR